MPELSTETLPLLPLTSGVVLPGMVVTATLETPESRSASSAAGDANQDIEGNEDAKVTFTAPAAGSYPFFCKYHPAVMKGTITVT